MDTVSTNGTNPGLFASWQARANASFPFLWEGLLRVAFDHLQGAISRGSRVADIGCGDGHITQAFCDQGSRVVGLDLHLPTLRALHQSYPDMQVVSADAESLPLPTESVDALFSFSTFQYVDRSVALKECSRVLRRGGRFAIVENLAGNPIAKAYRAWHRISGRRYPEHLSPKQHLSWGERRVYESHFSVVRYQALHLLTPILLLSGGAHGPRGQERVPGRRLFRAVDRLEQGVVSALPITRAACWHVVVCGTK